MSIHRIRDRDLDEQGRLLRQEETVELGFALHIAHSGMASGEQAMFAALIGR
jgi:hypothetical protein